MQLTNYEKWLLYTDSLISPQNYIDFGWYYIISAALQRRVWIGPDHARLYPNVYTILVGEPGIGKGLVIKQVTDILRYHKLKNPKDKTTLTEAQKTVTDADRIRMEAIADEEYRLAQESDGARLNGQQSNKVMDKPLLYPVASDATTYEALIRSCANSIRRINYVRYDDKMQRNVMDIYTHSSLCFSLEELSSLFRKKSEDLVKFLLKAYDCGDYEYDTKTQGKDRIKKCCLSLFGGTVPDFIQDSIGEKLLTEGFSSRAWFIYAARNRATRLWIPDLRQEQKDAYVNILAHVEKLSSLYGRLVIKPDDEQWLEEWWQNHEKNKKNSSSKLNSYFARKQVHVLKLAMAIHFSESFEMTIERPCFQRAIDMFEAEEKNMHLALGIESNNPLSVPTKKILKYLAINGAKTRKELAGEFWEILPGRMTDLDEILEYCLAQGKMRMIEIKNPITGSLMNGYEAITY